MGLMFFFQISKEYFDLIYSKNLDTNNNDTNNNIFYYDYYTNNKVILPFYDSDDDELLCMCNLCYIFRKIIF